MKFEAALQTWKEWYPEGEEEVQEAAGAGVAPEQVVPQYNLDQ